MSWRKLNLKDAKINFSKIIPYDDDLSIFKSKKGYYHNNRLTSLKKFTTTEALGYRCYKRKANQNHLIDGELTDYIELNKVTSTGLIPILEISDSYYKSEAWEHVKTSSAPSFFSGVVLDDTLMGPYTAWVGTVFYEIGSHIYISYNSNSGETKYIHTKQTHSPEYNTNYDVYTLEGIPVSSTYIFQNENYLYLCDDMGRFTNLLSEVQKKRKGYYLEEVHFLKLGKKTFSHTYTRCDFSHINTTEYDDNHISVTLDGIQLYKEDSVSEHQYSLTGAKVEIKAQITTDIEFCLPSWDSVNVRDTSVKTDSKTFSSVVRVLEYPTLLDKKQTKYLAFSLGSITGNSLQFSSLMSGVELSYTQPITYAVYTTATQSTNLTLHPETEISKDTSISIPDLRSIGLVSSNYVNDSVFTNNGFVVNYTNRIPVTLGHNYKVIARLDTQGSEFLGSDAVYSYIKQNGVIYKISIGKMFPDVAYDEEVNIIESEFCYIVSGYKIFNTTTYYNAIYNDSKILCSCDDWNGRYRTTSQTESNPILQSNSRVGQLWNSTQSFEYIPASAISDELTDILELPNPTYIFTNPDYTLHEGTTAYIYSQPDTMTDVKYQQVKVTREGFVSDYDETKQFANSENLQLVPSILFISYLKGDVNNLIQIGAEVYKLLVYAYSITTPALVYSMIAESIILDPETQEMVLQGGYYNISGSSDRKLITNPYDTASNTYCCDVTGLKYIGYDSVQGYFYSPATGIIYTFNGANRLNAFLEIDNKIPLSSTDKEGITVCNIPSINLVAIAFTDGVLVIINQQSIFIPVQTINSLLVNREYGLLKINNEYYYFSNNTVVSSIIEEEGEESQQEIELETCKIGLDWVTNITMNKFRFVVYSDEVQSDKKFKVEFTTNQNNQDLKQSIEKVLKVKDFYNGYCQFELTPKYTKGNYFQFKITSELDIVDVYLNTEDATEENVIR